MTDTPAMHLRQTLIEIDRQILDILTPHRPLDHYQLHKVATLERARGAAQRLLADAEAKELDAGA